MRPMALVVLLVGAGVLGAAAPALGKCELLYAEVAALIHEATEDRRDPQLLAQAKQCAEEGIKRHAQGRHQESMRTLRTCQKLLLE